MELGHSRKFYSPGNGKGERGRRRKFRGKTERADGLRLSFHDYGVAKRVHERRPFLKVAADACGKLTKAFDGADIGFEVKRCFVGAEPLYHVLIKRVVLSRQDCSSTLRDTAADGLGLGENAVNSRLSEQPRAQHSGHTASDDQHVGAYVAVERRKPRRCSCFCPEKIHY
ncbi:hypothetical protein SDC9_138575 [bioreactor metagenome]|uniref:Uncharacterized protein n=1 Tax=bioreactor metagenome TaxID=1076179 RepID=A0A645DQ75_9ZZZZ